MTVDAFVGVGPLATPPGPPGLPFLGVAPQIKRDPLGYFARIATEFDGVSTLPIGAEKVLLMNSPVAIEHVFQSNWRNYRKSDFYDKLRPLLGNGIATSEGDFWRRQRQITNPAFHRKSLTRMGEIMRDRTRDMIDGWADRAGGGAFDLSEDLTGLTLRIVVESLFGSDITANSDGGERTATIAHAVDTMLEVCERRVWAVPDLHDKWVSPLYWRHRKARAALDRIVYDIIAERRRTGAEHFDLLGMLLEARDGDTGEAMSDLQLRDETTTLLVTGHESTANAAMWIFFVLSQHPEIEQRVRDEIAAVCGAETPDDGQLRELTYLRMVIEEVLRVYPPAWTTSRTAIEEDNILGFPVEAGTSVMISPYVMHRNPRYWPNPEVFDPERHTPQMKESRPKYAYIPFGGGPRNCIGSNFAMMELQLVVAMVAQRYRVAVVNPEKVEREAIVSIRPKDGINVTIETV
jgi:cytochrome P450